MGPSTVRKEQTDNGERRKNRIQGSRMRYIVYGAGTPIEVETYSPEVAEAIVVEQFGVKIENIVAVREDHVVLHRKCDS